jgi:hypothetical protein
MFAVKVFPPFKTQGPFSPCPLRGGKNRTEKDRMRGKEM